MGSFHPFSSSFLTCCLSREFSSNQLSGTISTLFRALPLQFLTLGSNDFCYSVDYGNWVGATDYSSSLDCKNCNLTCENGGVCYNGELSSACSCPIYFTGPVCQFDLNTCRSFPCQNGGNCVNGIAGFTCDCSGTGYGGTVCTVLDPANNACNPGLAKNSTNGTCEACPPGTFSLSGTACVPCQKGTALNATGASTLCPTCPPGTFAATTASTCCSVCSSSSNCHVGSFASTSAYLPSLQPSKSTSVDKNGKAILPSSAEILWWAYAIPMAGFMLLSTFLLLPPVFRKCRRPVSAAGMILRTPMSFFQIKSGEIAERKWEDVEKPPYLRGIVALWVIVGVILITAYQSNVFVTEGWFSCHQCNQGRPSRTNSRRQLPMPLFRFPWCSTRRQFPAMGLSSP